MTDQSAELLPEVTISEEAKGNIKALEGVSWIVKDGWDAREAFADALTKMGIEHCGALALLTEQELGAVSTFKEWYAEQIKNKLKKAGLRLSPVKMNWQKLRDDKGAIDTSKIISLYELDTYHPYQNARYEIPQRFKGNTSVLIPLRDVQWKTAQGYAARIHDGLSGAEFAGELLFKNWSGIQGVRGVGYGWGNGTKRVVADQFEKMGLELGSIRGSILPFLLLKTDDRRKMLADLFDVDPNANPTVSRQLHEEWMSAEWIEGRLPDLRDVFSKRVLATLSEKPAVQRARAKFSPVLAQAVVKSLLKADTSKTSGEDSEKPKWLTGGWIAQNLPPTVRENLIPEFLNKAANDRGVIRTAKEFETDISVVIKRVAVLELRAIAGAIQKPATLSEPVPK